MIYKIIFMIILILILYYIYNYPKYNEKFDNSLTSDQLKIIANLSPHLITIKKISDLANTLLTTGSVPCGLIINGPLTVGGVSNLNSDLTITGALKNIGNSEITGTLTVDGVSKMADVTSTNLTLNGVLNVSGALNVSGKSTLSDTQINSVTTGLTQIGAGITTDLVVTKKISAASLLLAVFSIKIGNITLAHSLLTDGNHINQLTMHNDVDPLEKFAIHFVVNNLGGRSGYGVTNPWNTAWR